MGTNTDRNLIDIVNNFEKLVVICLKIVFLYVGVAISELKMNKFAKFIKHC